MKRPDHLFVSSGGDLYDTRKQGWHTLPPLRTAYEWQSNRVENTHQLRATLRAGQYAWPGGYQLAFVTSDGGLLCFDCVRENYRSVSGSIRNEINDGWRVEAVTIMHDGEAEYYECCDHCSKVLALAQPDESEDLEGN